jgi:hypothetical protein
MTDPGEVAAAMSTGQAAESARQSAGLAAVTGPPPEPDPAGPNVAPLPVRVVVTDPEDLADALGYSVEEGNG